MPTGPRIVLYAGDSAGAADTRDMLLHAGYEVALDGFESPLRDDLSHLVVVDSHSTEDRALELCRRRQIEATDGFVPILFLGHAHLRQQSLEAGADAFLVHPVSAPELRAQVQALLRTKSHCDKLASRGEELERVHKRLHTAYQQINMELEFARNIQQSLLPRDLPDLPRARFGVVYRPCSRVGGDFYDVFRLDEEHVGFYIADAMGHGVPASLLTVFVKLAVQPKEINGNEYRLVAPNLVLKALNRDLLHQGLAERPFITMVYALFDAQSGALSFSRGGHPHPLYIPREGPVRFWPMDGGLLGVFEAEYHVQTHRLMPGDKVLFFTDGIDGAAFERRPLGSPSLLAAAEKCRQLPPDQLVQRLAGELHGETDSPDDMTLLAVEFTG